MYSLESMPSQEELETIKVLKKSISANRALAEFKGICLSIPNQSILISTLALQEAKNGSEIENIITTHDELFDATISPEIMSVSVVSKILCQVQNFRNSENAQQGKRYDKH